MPTPHLSQPSKNFYGYFLLGFKKFLFHFVFIVVCFETGSLYVAGLEPMILLLLPPKCCDYRRASLCTANFL
jgi:hypothetical protein